jgi:hypothetical protein
MTISHPLQSLVVTRCNLSAYKMFPMLPKKVDGGANTICRNKYVR